MKITEIFSQAFESLTSNKLRSSLTMLGIVVGIFSIVSISTVIEMLQSSIEQGVSQLGQNTFQIQKLPAVMTGGPGEFAKYRQRKDITIEDFYKLKDRLKETPNVGAEQWSYGTTLKFMNKETNPTVQVAGVTPEAFPNNSWTIADGRAIGYSDLERYEPVAVLGSDVVKTLFEGRNPIGQEIRIDGNLVRVIGVIEDKGQLFGESRGNNAVLPYTTFTSFFGKRVSSINITVMASDKSQYEDLVTKAEGFMRTVRKVPPGKENDFDIFTNQSLMSTINDMTMNVRIGAIVISLIALIVAGVGIMNIMLVSVTERTREIGVRKAIGARKSTILFQFLIEAVILCLLGGIIGIVLGVSAGNIAGSLIQAKAAIPIDWILIGIMLCVAIGVGFGTYPAYKAANLDPIEALRYE